MSDLIQIALDMWRPYYLEYSDYFARSAAKRPARWADFVRRTNQGVAIYGDIESIEEEDFDNLNFCDKDGYPFVYFMPWRGSLGSYDDEREEFYKNHPEEPERLRALLRKAEALLAAKKTATAAAPVAKLATA